MKFENGNNEIKVMPNGLHRIDLKTIKRMYSEGDMAESFMACWKANVPEGFECKLSFNEWFEQFKKK